MTALTNKRDEDIANVMLNRNIILFSLGLYPVKGCINIRPHSSGKNQPPMFASCFDFDQITRTALTQSHKSTLLCSCFLVVRAKA